MRITIEPTGIDPNRVSVVVAMKSDDLSIDETVRLIKGALVAWGFTEETVDEAMGGE